MMLRVLTQNLYNGRADPASLAAALERHAPDVVAVQELSPNAVQVLEEWGSVSLLDPRHDTTGMGMAIRGEAVMSRIEFPFRDPIRAHLAGPTPQVVDIINVHLFNPITRPISRSLSIRSRELTAVEAVLAQPEQSVPRVLVGDFNSSPAWPIYRRLRTLAVDAAVATGTARRTWGLQPTSPRLLRIDHAFVQNLKPLRTELVKVVGADHRGLLVDLELIR